MKKIIYTYTFSEENNHFAQKTASATVFFGSNALNEFEDKMRGRFGDTVIVNHTAKHVHLPDSFEEQIPLKNKLQESVIYSP